MATQIDLSALVDTPIRDLLPEAAVKEILTSHPFIPIPLALNLRTISFPPHLPPNLIFRSGALSHLPPAALTQLKETYNISTIFDLRSATERKNSPSPDIPGIKTIWIPSAVDIDASVNGQEHWRTARFNVAHADFVENNGQDGFVKMYDTVLETHREPYKAVFENLRDGEGGVLFHCTGP
jgi:protein tyrosine/serine phosphatase